MNETVNRELLDFLPGEQWPGRSGWERKRLTFIMLGVGIK